jgi:hypothetical protein
VNLIARRSSHRPDKRSRDPPAILSPGRPPDGFARRTRPSPDRAATNDAESPRERTFAGHLTAWMKCPARCCHRRVLGFGVRRQCAPDASVGAEHRTTSPARKRWIFRKDRRMPGRRCKVFFGDSKDWHVLHDLLHASSPAFQISRGFAVPCLSRDQSRRRHRLHPAPPAAGPHLTNRLSAKCVRGSSRRSDLRSSANLTETSFSRTGLPPTPRARRAQRVGFRSRTSSRAVRRKGSGRDRLPRRSWHRRRGRL